MAFNVENKWWVSPSDFDKEVTDTFGFPKKIEILDTTLRDGEQQAGIILTKEEKVEIAKKLDEVGVHRIEAGCPAVSQEDVDAIKAITSLGLKADIYAFIRNMVQDVDLALSTGVDGVIAEVPGSEHLLKGGMGWTVEKAIDAAIKTTSYAHEKGLKVTFFPADGSRASVDFLMDTVEAIIKGGGHMDGLALVDTFGAFSPEGAARRVKQLIERFPGVEIEIHAHDDFGLGTAVALAGLNAGAAVAHVTVNGIGERAGSAPLEPLVMALEVLYGQELGMNTPKLKELSDLVAKHSRFPVPPSLPIVGDEIFKWETGMPSMLWSNVRDVNPLIMLPYRWELVGQREPILELGKKSGKANLADWMKRFDVAVPEDKQGELLQDIKLKSIELKRTLTEAEFKELAAKYQ